MTDEELTRLLRAGLRPDRRAPGGGCPPEAELWELAAGALSGDGAPAVREHLAACSRCAAEAGRYSAGVEQLRKRRPRLRRRMASIVAACPERPQQRLLLRPHWLAAGAALLVLIVVLSHAALRDAGRDPWNRLMAAEGSADLQQARAHLRDALPQLFPGSGAVLRSDEHGPIAGGPRPDEEALLPGDPVTFLPAGDGGARPPFGLRVVQERPDPGRVVLHRRSLRSARERLPGSESRWRPGVYWWAMTGAGSEPVGDGRFEVLGGPALQLVERAERELAAEPERLAAVYYLLGLRQRFEDAFARLRPDRQAALRARLRPSAGETPRD